MYLPSAFRESRCEVLEGFVRAHPFATVVAPGHEGPAANHLPLELAEGTLRGHVARGNELAAQHGMPVLAIFHGPQGYVSPNWYPSKRATEREVPTWNYAVVHAHGRLRVIDDARWMRDFLHALTARHEAGEPVPWSLDDAAPGHIDALLRGVLGIEIAIERIEGKFKLGQNKPEADRRGVLAGLDRRGLPGDAALAAMTADTLSPSPTWKTP